MIDLVQSDVAGLAVTVERVPGRNGFADNLIVRNQAAGEGPGILILSHIDTVHPIGTLAGPLPFRRDGDRLYGPGLFDMKGGAYLALEAFRQVAKAKSAKLPVTFVFTPDEEVGSPTSRALIEAEAKKCALRAGHRAGARRRQDRHLTQRRRPLRGEDHRRAGAFRRAPSGRPQRDQGNGAAGAGDRGPDRLCARRDHDGRDDFRRHRAERHSAALPYHGRPARVRRRGGRGVRGEDPGAGAVRQRA